MAVASQYDDLENRLDLASHKKPSMFNRKEDWEFYPFNFKIKVVKRLWHQFQFRTSSSEVVLQRM